MEFFEKNKEALQKRFSTVVKEMEKEEKENSALKVEFLKTRDGNHALVVETEEKKYRLNSAYRPMEEAKKWADQYEFQNLDINVFMFGFGNGIFVRELLHRAAVDSEVYLWEPNAEIFRYVLEKEDITDILTDRRFHIFLGEEGLQDYKNIVDYVLNWHNAATQIHCSHICYDQLFEKEYQEFMNTVYSANQMMRVRRDTNVWFAHRTVTNTLRNLRYIEHSNYITELMGKIPDDIPAIIVSAGPSLEKNMSLLKKAEGRAFIVATDSAVRVLEANGLPYDCINTVDPGKPTWYLSKFPGSKEKPLFCTMQAPAKLMEFHAGRKIWGGNSFFIDILYGRFGMFFPNIDAGGSVATDALELIRLLGFKTVILIGQDLAYDGEKTHAGGYENHVLNEDAFIEMVEGIHGDSVRTRHDWKMFRNWFEYFIQEHEDIKVVDATEGGALIHGSEVMAFAEAIDRYCEGKEFDFHDFLAKVPETFEVLDFNPFRENILDLEKGFHNIVSKAAEGKKLAEEYISSGRKISKKKSERILKSIKKINLFIERQTGYALLDMYTYELAVDELKDVNCITGDEYTDTLNSLKSSIEIYNGFLQAVKELEEILKTSLSGI